jgi:hypothetical protein
MPQHCPPRVARAIRLTAAVLALVIFVGVRPVHAADDLCLRLLQAGGAWLEAPRYAMHMQTSSASGKDEVDEVVIDTAKYTSVGGSSWAQTRRLPKEKIAEIRSRNLQAKLKEFSNCRPAGPATIDGQLADVFAYHQTDPGGTSSEARIWISRANGLALRLEGDSTGKEIQGVQHSLITLRYSDVQPPKGKILKQLAGGNAH